jgi:hypothetical protein
LIPQGDLTIELQAISILLNDSYLKTFNIYIPPASASAHYQPDISKVLETDDDALILGDLNAHHVAWQSNLSDDCSDFLAKTGLQFVDDTLPARPIAGRKVNSCI